MDARIEELKKKIAAMQKVVRDAEQAERREESRKADAALCEKYWKKGLLPLDMYIHRAQVGARMWYIISDVLDYYADHEKMKLHFYAFNEITLEKTLKSINHLRGDKKL